MSEEKHWDNIAEKYEEEVLNAFQSDRDKKLEAYFKKHRNKKSTAIDFGCGIGNGFHYLSPNFKKVVAVDISQNCLDLAKQKGFDNIVYKQMDLTEKNLKISPSEFVLCSNVAIFADLEMNYAIFRNVRKVMKKQGTALFVVPSQESSLFHAWRLIDWYRQEGTEASKMPKSELSYFRNNTLETLQGIIEIDGRPTKHYSSSELQVIFKNAKLEVTAIERLEYDWTTEFESPPDWMKDPYPWDWLIECGRA